MRTFKLNRMKNLNLTNESFIREMPVVQSYSRDNNTPSCTVSVKMRVSPIQAYRIYDEFNESQIGKNEDGSFLVNFTYPEDDWVYGYILSFGNYAEVLEPDRIREIIKNRLQDTLSMYK